MRCCIAHGYTNLLRESLEAVQQTAAVILEAISTKPEEAQEPGPSGSERDSTPYSAPQKVDSAAA